MKRKIGIFLLLGFAASTAQADTLMTTREGTLRPGADAAQDKGSTVRFWSGSDRMARIDDRGKMISDLESGVTYLLNDQAKSCFAIPRQQIDAEGGTAGQVEVRETNETRQIGPWQAKVYELTAIMDGEPIEISVWVSEDVSVDVGGLRAYTASRLTPEMTWMLKMFDLGGYPVRQEVRMGPIRSWGELVAVEEKSAPAGTYDIPAGYSGCD
jgi:hypothetical protein